MLPDDLTPISRADLCENATWSIPDRYQRGYALYEWDAQYDYDPIRARVNKASIWERLRADDPQERYHAVRHLDYQGDVLFVKRGTKAFRVAEECRAALLGNPVLDENAYDSAVQEAARAAIIDAAWWMHGVPLDGDDANQVACCLLDDDRDTAMDSSEQWYPDETTLRRALVACELLIPGPEDADVIPYRHRFPMPGQLALPLPQMADYTAFDAAGEPVAIGA